MYTAFYAPKGKSFAQNDFTSIDEAKEYIQSRKDLDEYAWFILPTEVYKKCEDIGDIMAGAGYYPACNRGSNMAPTQERLDEYENICKKLGIKSEITQAQY